jgi:hypothetical protein
MEIRIRRASEAKGRHLTTSSLEKLDQVIPTLESIGFADPDEGRPLDGRICVDDVEDGGRAFYEVVIDDSED